MRVVRFFLCFVAVMMVTPLAMAKGTPDGFADLVTKLNPAVVNISTAQRLNKAAEPGSLRDKMGGKQALSLGSGFIITSSGIVVTNNHVIQNADEIMVTLNDGREFTATLRGRDELTDLAVLQMQGLTVKLPSVKFGDSKKSRVGDWVVAIGNPFGLGGSVSAGIISASNRNIESGLYDDYIQTDAAINRGNSGGPLFNMDGSVIGVNTAIFSQTGGSVGVGFAVSSDLATNVVRQLIDKGEVRRGFLGVNLRDVEKEDLTNSNLPNMNGAYVESVNNGTPAQRAGMKPGDVVISFDGREISESRDLNRAIADAEVGKALPLKVRRNGQVVKLSVILQLRQPDVLAFDPLGQSQNLPKGAAMTAGMTLEKPSTKIRNRWGISGPVEGVVVTAIDPKSPVALVLQPGDVIIEMAWQKAESPKGVAASMEKLRKLNSGSVQVYVRRGDLLFYELIRP